VLLLEWDQLLLTFKADGFNRVHYSLNSLGTSNRSRTKLTFKKTHITLNPDQTASADTPLVYRDILVHKLCRYVLDNRDLLVCRVLLVLEMS